MYCSNTTIVMNQTRPRYKKRSENNSLLLNLSQTRAQKGRGCGAGFDALPPSRRRFTCPLYSLLMVKTSEHNVISLQQKDIFCSKCTDAPHVPAVGRACVAGKQLCARAGAAGFRKRKRRLEKVTCPWHLCLCLHFLPHLLRVSQKL
jgi:hypothetical protein